VGHAKPHMKQFNTLCTIALLVVLCACSAGSGHLSPSGLENSATTRPLDTEQPAATSRNVLRTTMPALGAVATGTEFTFTIAVELSEPLFQGSGRVVYDPRLLEPISAERGGLIPASDIFIAPLAAELPPETIPAGMAAVPFAFTGLPGGSAIAPQTGELLRIRFRLRQAVDHARPVYLLNNQAYLQLRDATGARIPYDLDTQEVGR
jgi:hypothetical protein